MLRRGDGMTVRRRREPEPGGGGGCETERNERHILYVGGSPTGGDIGLLYNIDGTEQTVTIEWDSSSAEAVTAFETDHDEVDEDDVAVSGGSLPGSSLVIEFQNGLRNKRIVTPVVVNNLTGGLSPFAMVVVDQPGYPEGV